MNLARETCLWNKLIPQKEGRGGPREDSKGGKGRGDQDVPEVWYLLLMDDDADFQDQRMIPSLGLCNF